MGQQIVETAGDGRAFGLSVRYSFDGPKLLGTAGAIRQALAKIPGPAFFVLYGDSYLECDYGAVQAAFAGCGKAALMTVLGNEQRWEPSNVELADGRILAYDKKDRTTRMRHIDYGLGVFHKQAFDLVTSDEPYDLATLYQELLRRNQLAYFEVFQRFYEIGSPRGLEETRQYLASPSTARVL